MAKSDAQLIKAIQKGNYECFDELYQRYVKKIYEFVFFKANGNKSLAQDVTSETFLKVFEKIDSFNLEEKGSFSSRIYTIAYNTFIDQIRKQENQSKSLEEVAEPSYEVDYLSYVQNKDKTKAILDYLDFLGGDKKELFIMRIWNDLSYDEIASVLGKSAESCRQEFSRTLRKIIEKFPE